MLTVARSEKKTYKVQAVYTAFAVVAAVLLPEIFHAMGAASGVGSALGEIFLPMHLPVILVGLLAGAYAGAIAGALSPIVSFAITGMPSPVMLPFITVELLQNGDYTCVLIKGESVYESRARGVKPLLEWLDDKTDLNGAYAADKVVGKAAAFLYVLLGVKAVYAPVVSVAATEVFSAYGIEMFSDVQAEAIINRSGTGYCPMETAVRGISSPNVALQAIREALSRLAK